jgi:hypothetical protein
VIAKLIDANGYMRNTIIGDRSAHFTNFLAPTLTAVGKKSKFIWDISILNFSQKIF